jgi:hypothetical protein
MLEDGYMVTTVLDGHKLNINPHAVQLRSSEIVVLDSSRSVFYTLPFPISQGNKFHLELEVKFITFHKCWILSVEFKEKKKFVACLGTRVFNWVVLKKTDLNWVCGPHHINGGHNFVLWLVPQTRARG